MTSIKNYPLIELYILFIVYRIFQAIRTYKYLQIVSAAFKSNIIELGTWTCVISYQNGICLISRNPKKNTKDETELQMSYKTD